jgi:hypothetical protein
LKVGDDGGERLVELIEGSVLHRLVDEGLHRFALDEATIGKRPVGDQRIFDLQRDALQIEPAVAARIQSADETPHTGPDDDVRHYAMGFQGFDYADMREAAGSATAQRQRDFRRHQLRQRCRDRGFGDLNHPGLRLRAAR